MRDTTSFPGPTHTVGKAFAGERLSAGFTAAERFGIPRDRPDPLMARDGPPAASMLCLPG